MLSYLAIAMSAMSRQQLAEAGILRLPRRDSWLAFLVVTAILIKFGRPGSNPPQLETVLFQLTMPGLDEEILFRGLLIWAFDAALPATKRILGVDVSMGALLSSLLFGLGHGVYFNEAGSIAVNITPLLFTLIVGLMLTWLRLRCGSIWPAVIAHNLGNGTGELIALLS